MIRGRRSAEADLQWFMMRGLGLMSRSTFGEEIARLWNQHQEHQHPPFEIVSLRWESLDRVSGEYRCGLQDHKIVVQSIAQRGTPHDEPSYEVDFETLHRLGRVSRALYRLEKASPVFTSALMAYYGQRGERWALEPGEGRLVSILPLTNTGRRWLDAQARHTSKDGSVVDIREDERLQNEYIAQSKCSDETRQARFQRILSEARQLQRDALSAYLEVCNAQ